MKAQKILALSLCAALLGGSTAYAADFTADERGIVNFADSFDVSQFEQYKEHDGHRYTLGDYDKYFSYKVTDSQGNIQNFGQIISDGTGDVNFSFRIKGETGEYTLTLTNVKLGAKTYTIDYVNNIYIDFNDVKNGGNAELMSEFLIESGTLFGFDTKAFSLLTSEQRGKIIDKFLAFGDATSLDNLVELAKSTNVVDALFETADKPETLTQYILDNAAGENTVFNKSIVNVFEKELSDDEKSAVTAALMGSPLNSDAVAKFDFQVLKSRVHQIKYFSDMDLIILSDGNIWGFADKDLKNYKSCDTASVQKAMLSAIDSVDGIDEYRTKFGSLVNANSDDDSGSSGGGGGGKVSKGGGSAVVSGGKTQDYEVSGSGFLTPEQNVTQQADQTAKKAEFKDLDGFDWAKEAIKTLSANYIINGVSDTEFEPSRTIKREEFVKLITTGLRLTGAEYETTFADVSKDDWFFDAVGAAQRAELIGGDENGFFGTGREITRQDAAVILARTASYKGVTLGGDNKTAFSDADQVADYAKSGVEKLAKAGIINGTDDGRFAPGASLTRAEAAVMLYNFFKALTIIK